MRCRSFFMSAVLVLTVAALSTPAATYNYTEQFKGIKTLGAFGQAIVTDIGGISESELGNYMQDSLCAALKARFPNSIRIAVSTYKADAIVAASADIHQGASGHFGNATLTVMRGVELAGATRSKPFLTSVYQRNFSIVGAGDPAGIKSQVCDAIDDLVAEFASDFHAARPDL